MLVWRRHSCLRACVELFPRYKSSWNWLFDHVLHFLQKQVRGRRAALSADRLKILPFSNGFGGAKNLWVCGNKEQHRQECLCHTIVRGLLELVASNSLYVRLKCLLNASPWR
jgi:hypothetical protein